jgi:hypothetical protein
VAPKGVLELGFCPTARSRIRWSDILSCDCVHLEYCQFVERSGPEVKSADCISRCEWKSILKKSPFNFSILTWHVDFQPGLLLTIFLVLKLVNKRGWVVLDDRWEVLHSTLSNLTDLINPDIQTQPGSNPPTPSTNNIGEGEK